MTRVSIGKDSELVPTHSAKAELTEVVFRERRRSLFGSSLTRSAFLATWAGGVVPGATLSCTTMSGRSARGEEQRVGVNSA
jgi:hypothetical protein